MSHPIKLGNRKPIADINMVPFIDVMLVLLVIFMITAPLLTQGVKVELPRTDAKAIADAKKEPIILTVDAEGKLFLNIADHPQQAIPAMTLNHLIKQALENPAAQERPVLVRGDKNVSYGRVMEAMSLLQQAGAKKVGLITEPPPQNRNAG